MGYDKTWSVTTNRSGRETKLFSPIGEATIVKGEKGWEVVGERTGLPRYDARQIVPTVEEAQKDWAKLVDQKNYDEVQSGGGYERGKFKKTGKDYRECWRVAFVSLSLMPARVPFKVAKNDHDKYAEAARDYELFQKRLAEHANACLTNPELAKDERFSNPEIAYQLLVLENYKMSYRKEWDLTREQFGNKTVVSSAKGKFEIVKNDKGEWVVKGVVFATTTDNRVFVKGTTKFTKEIPTPAKMTSVPGTFEFTKKKFNEALEAGNQKIALIPVRCKYEQLGEPSAEAKRDQAFFSERLAEYAKTGNILEPNAAAYQMLVLGERVPPTPLTPESTPGVATPFDITDLLDELNSLTGLGRIKTDVNQLVNFLRVQQLRIDKGLSIPEQSLHMVFTGNPGTGKTTIARLISQIYKSMGILSGGQFVETDRPGLVGGYLGQTALKTKAVVKSAIGGVLFIDEAYSLTDDTHGRDMYGQEAVSTLLKLMEDHRDDLIVIVAGYTEPMQKFIRSNPGLQSRFNKFLHFDDYSPAELTEIFQHFATQGDYKLHPATELKLNNVFTMLYGRRDETFGNARLARNLFEKAINAHANRMVLASAMDEESLVTLYPEDVPNA